MKVDMTAESKLFCFITRGIDTTAEVDIEIHKDRGGIQLTLVEFFRNYVSRPQAITHS